jgi:hypothetical protein
LPGLVRKEEQEGRSLEHELGKKTTCREPARKEQTGKKETS